MSEWPRILYIQIASMFTIAILLLAMNVFHVGTVQININEDYKADFNSCKAELAASKPVCAPTDCGSTGTVYAILGFLMFIAGMGFWFYSNRQIDKKKK